MRKLLTALLLTLLLVSSLPAANAQEADMAYFASFEGLDRVIARSWMAPMTFADPATPESMATPVVATPGATPVSSSGIDMVSVFVYLFDSDENAATGWQRIDDELQETILRDSRAPMTDSLPLDDVGDAARGYMGDLAMNGITITHTFATVQDGPFVYSISAMFSGSNGAELTRDYADALIATPMDRMVEQYNQNGTSRGGLWHKINAVQPEMPDGSTVTDFIVYPMESATPVASIQAVTLGMQSGNLADIAGIQDAHGMTYEQGNGSATPVPDQSGVFRIATWIMSFDSEQSASNAVSPLANSLAYPVNVNASSNSITQSNDVILTSTIQSGTIVDKAFPAGSATIHVQQVESTVYAVAVFVTDGDPSPIAGDLVQQMIDTPASGAAETIASDGTAEGGVWARFPASNDPLLGGTVPVKTMQPFSQPAATPAS